MTNNSRRSPLKEVSSFAELIREYSPPGAVILDPFRKKTDPALIRSLPDKSFAASDSLRSFAKPFADAAAADLRFPQPDAGPETAAGICEAILRDAEERLRQCAKAMKSKAYILLLCQNVILPNGVMIPFAFDLCRSLQKHFTLKAERLIPPAHETDGGHSYVLIAKKRADETGFEQNYPALLALARELTADGDIGVIGSFGMYLTFPKLLDHRPMDLDLAAKNDPETLRRAVRILIGKGFEVYSWQDRIDERFSYDLLKGRYYIRAVKGSLTVDLTYELEGADHQTLWPYYERAGEIGVFSREGQICLLQNADRPDLRERLSLLKRAVSG